MKCFAQVSHTVDVPYTLYSMYSCIFYDQLYIMYHTLHCIPSGGTTIQITGRSLHVPFFRHLVFYYRRPQPPNDRNKRMRKRQTSNSSPPLLPSSLSLYDFKGNITRCPSTWDLISRVRMYKDKVFTKV